MPYGVATLRAMADLEFSVIIPTFNRSGLILAAVRSALTQADVTVEVVVVDDGSTDETLEVLDAAGLSGLSVVSREQGGISAARNTGAREALGRWLVFLDDDDKLLPGHLSAMRKALSGDRIAAATCGVQLVDPEGKVLEEQLPVPLGDAFDGVVARFVAGALGVDADAFHGAGGYLEGLQCSHQTEFAFRLLDWCAANDRSVASVERVFVEILRPGPEFRSEASPEKLLEGSEMVLSRHEERFNRDRRLKANFHSVAGVAAARLGHHERARQHLFRAVRATPTDPRSFARMLVSMVPAVSRRVWRADRYARAGKAGHRPNGSGTSLA